jgi:hypothetical protein
MYVSCINLVTKSNAVIRNSDIFGIFDDLANILRYEQFAFSQLVNRLYLVGI